MNGFFNLYKEEGVSSAYCVNRLKRLTGEACGHLGTLDPLAEGVLPVGVGNATRLFDYFLGKEKVYRARFRFGATTRTLDREGELVRGGEVPSEEALCGVLARFTGEFDQTPPAFSAKSVGGRRSYELARAGIEAELQPKRVSVSRFELIEKTAPDEFEFVIACGGGTYIRSLARDVGEALGTLAYMTYLKRERSGVFGAESAVRLADLTPRNLENYLIPTDSVLPFPVLTVEDERLYHGLKIPCEREDGVYKLYDGTKFYGLARVERGLVKAEKKLC